MENQCDGCRRGLPLRDGIHYDKDRPYMACTRDRYKPPRCGECLHWPPEPDDPDSGCSAFYLADPEDEASDCFTPREEP